MGKHRGKHVGKTNGIIDDYYITRLSYEYIFFRASQEFPIFLDSKEEDAVEQRVEIDSGADMTVETYPVYLGAPQI